MTGDLAMQMRCIQCRREQYAPAVLAISHGEHPCVWCGHTPPQLTVAEYQARMRSGQGREPTAQEWAAHNLEADETEALRARRDEIKEP